MRATLESLAYQCYDLLYAMEQDLGHEMRELRVDGGACANNFLMQFQADMLQKQVVRPQCIETTSLGAAYLAGLAVGYWKSTEDVLKNWQRDKTFAPVMEEEKRESLLQSWAEAVKRCRNWAK